jgi:hypothetical protein
MSKQVTISKHELDKALALKHFMAYAMAQFIWINHIGTGAILVFIDLRLLL